MALCSRLHHEVPRIVIRISTSLDRSDAAAVRSVVAMAPSREVRDCYTRCQHARQIHAMRPIFRSTALNDREHKQPRVLDSWPTTAARKLDPAVLWLLCETLNNRGRLQSKSICRDGAHVWIWHGEQAPWPARLQHAVAFACMQHTERCWSRMPNRVRSDGMM